VLEPDEGKLSSPVLRGLSGRKAARLPGGMLRNLQVRAARFRRGNLVQPKYCQSAMAWSVDTSSVF
jgi:hypothetical protein